MKKKIQIELGDDVLTIETHRWAKQSDGSATLTYKDNVMLVTANMKDEAKEEKRLVDATHGRRTRSIIVMDSNHIILSAIQAETVSQRYTTLKELP